MAEQMLSYTADEIDSRLGLVGNHETMLADGNINLENAKAIYIKNGSGSPRRMVIENSSNQAFYGYDSREYKEGASFYDGHAIYLRSNTHIYMQAPSGGLSGYREYGLNRLLWSGAQYMAASTTVTLTESISSQVNGVILVWSHYNSGALNEQLHSCFVPKRLVASHGGCGHTMFLMMGGANYAGSKYVYISDTQIVGHDNNQKTYTGSNGITITNTRFVLRYVIGV